MYVCMYVQYVCVCVCVLLETACQWDFKFYPFLLSFVLFVFVSAKNNCFFFWCCVVQTSGAEQLTVEGTNIYFHRGTEGTFRSHLDVFFSLFIIIIIIVTAAAHSIFLSTF